ncbi:MAG TPA: glycosyltransferase family 9 protein [Chthoniobacterales bacterium]
MRRILVIRGGAIGDFVLTLPVIGALRNGFPNARIEILGYKHIVVLAEQRFYADASRSIEYAGLAAFFGRGTELPSDLCDYFSSFDLIISYLFDPDGNFERNLRRCGVEEILHGPGKIAAEEHAARQLARPVAELGLTSDTTAARIYPSASDREFAAAFLRELNGPIFALHPGSGSERKNWPVERWLQLGDELRMSGSLLIIGGEADRERLAAFSSRLPALFAENFGLPALAAMIERCAVFIGHDSGISHIAAAVGTPCVLLFGPTDPRIWAPTNDNVHVIRAPAGDLTKLETSAVLQELMRIGIST